MFCKYCGQEVFDDAVVCVHCGRALKETREEDLKSGLVVLLLCIFVGFLGVHRFYTGHVGIGVAQLLTAGGCGIWVLIDLIMIVTGSFKDSDGRTIIL